MPYHRWSSPSIPRATARDALSWRSRDGSTPSMSHAPTAALSARHRTIRQALAARSLDALVVTSLPNILYLTNFTGSSAIAILTGDRLHFLTDFRYLTVVSGAGETPFACPDLTLVRVEGAYDATLAEQLAPFAGK